MNTQAAQKIYRGKLLKLLGTKDGGFVLHQHGIQEIHGRWQPFHGHYVEIRYETAGDLHRRFTATRIALFGVFALAWKKRKDDRTAYVTVEVDGQPWAVHEIKPTKAGDVLAFSKRIASVAASE